MGIIGDFELGSIEYAVEHLGVRLVVVVGHSVCGAVEAAIHGGAGGYTKAITDEIKGIIGDETDPYSCEKLNTHNSVNKIKSSPVISELMEKDGLVVCGGHYHNHSGEFTLLDEYKSGGVFIE